MHLKLLRILRKAFQQHRRFEATDTNAIQTSTQPIQGLFGNLLLQNPKGFKLLNTAVESRSIQLVGEIVHNAEARAKDPNQRTTVQLLDDLSNEICCAADLADCVRCMHTDIEFKKAAEESTRFLTCLVEILNTTPELYHALKQSLETEIDRLDPISMRTAKLLLEDFEHSGVLLDDEQRQHFVQLSNEVFDAGTKFGTCCDRQVPLNAEEQEQIGAKGTDLNGPWIQNRDYKIRRFTHAKYFAHNQEQESSLRRLISARHRLAKLTNFPTFAHRAQSNAVLCTYENVQKFLQNTIKQFSDQVNTELDQVHRIVRENSLNFDPSRDRLGLSDVEFATSVRHHQLIDHIGPDHPSLSSFFHLGTILDGFEWLIQQLYGLYFRQSLPHPGECWTGSNVLKLDVHRQEGKTFLGTIFLDLDVRPTKMQGDCHFTVRCSKLLADGEYQTPIVVVSLAILSTDLQQTLHSPWEMLERATMSPQHAENFFHEMGHAMHSILGRTKFQHVAGTRCPTDFAEVPSHLMECFFNDHRILHKICRDKSGRSLGKDQADAIIQSRKIFNAVHTTQQAIYALFDLELHGEHAEDVAEGHLVTTDLFGQINSNALPQLENGPDYAYHHRISHLVTYGAKYYSYLVARASAAKIYERLFSSDPFSCKNGQKWADVQSLGGEYPTNILLAKALDTPSAPSPEQLTTVLIGT